jgi:hypothetical protein
MLEPHNSIACNMNKIFMCLKQIWIWSFWVTFKTSPNFHTFEFEVLLSPIGYKGGLQALWIVWLSKINNFLKGCYHVHYCTTFGFDDKLVRFQHILIFSYKLEILWPLWMWVGGDILSLRDFHLFVVKLWECVANIYFPRP